MRHIPHLVILLVLVLLVVNGCASFNVSGKYFNAPAEDVRHWVAPCQVAQYASVDAAWTTLESGYVYRTDNWVIADHWGQNIAGGDDTWLRPVEVQYLLDHYPLAHGMDCEDGSLWLTSALQKLGKNAWLCVGTVKMKSGTYGHAWCMVKEGSTWMTYETTADTVSEGLPLVYDESGEVILKYTLYWRTNGSEVFQNPTCLFPGGTTPITSIPPDKIAELREALR